MKQVSTGYKNQIKEMGREIDSIITYYNHYQVITENNKYILTEDGQKILTEQINQGSYIDITAEDIYSVKIITHGDLLKTMMKELDFEVRQDMKIGSLVSYKFGLKVNGQYEYVDYGEFIVQNKEFNEDTKTYSYVAYDKMLFTMIPYEEQDISELTGPYTLFDLASYCCQYCGLNLGVEYFPNEDREINDDTLSILKNGNFTFRDVLDFITEVTGCSSYMIDNSFIISPPQETSNVLPSGYTQVDYIQTSGTQYINTGVIGKTGLEVEANIEFVDSISNDQAVIGSRSGGTRIYPIYIFPGKFDIGYGINYNSSLTPVLNQKYSVYSKLYNGEQLLKVNGTTIIQQSVANDFDTNLNLYLFCMNYNGASYFSKMKLYSLIIKENGTTKRNFVPCYRNSDNEIGLYDIVNNVFYTNQGTGSFTYGNVVSNKLVLYANSFKDTNVTFSKMYGPINSIVFSRGDDTDFVEIKDDESIAQNGVTQLKIKDNPFLEGNDRSDYFEEMFEVLNGLTYTLNDLSSTGVTYLDYFDKFDVEIDDNTYPCLLLNDEIIIEQGLQENIFTGETEGAEHEYVTSRIDDRGQKWANIQVKKDVGEIVLEVGKVNDDITQINTDLDGKVGDNEIISKINLSPEQITINSNKLSLNGKTIALTSDNINISSNNFSVDTNGNMTCNNATMSNATITSGNITIPEGSAGYGVEVHGTGSDGTTTYYTRQRAAAFTCFRNNVLMARLHDGSSTSVGGILQLYNSSGTMTIQGNGATGVIICTSVNPSLEENKKNIEKFSNGLQVVKDTDIYRFNYKYEEDNIKRHIGFVIGDKYNYSKEVTSNDNDGADLYSMISVLWQAVKEQQKEIEELKERIDK